MNDVDQALAKMRLNRPEANTAIAHDYCRDAVPAGPGQIGIPVNVAVIMPMDIGPLWLDSFKSEISASHLASCMETNKSS